jgi:hypothetical protein
MAVWIWLGIGLLVGLILLVAWAADRRSERRGHHVRSVKDLSRDLGEQNRDSRVLDAQEDGSWKYRPRRPGDRS